MYKIVQTLFMILCVLLLCAAKKEGPPPESGSVIMLKLDRVIDGDTFVAGGQKVRLWGIDAPEEKTNYYLASKLYLEVILKEAKFSCHYRYKDRYKRFVMQCFSNGTDIASMIVRMGLAKDYPKYSRGHYESDQKFAIENRYGIWRR